MTLTKTIISVYIPPFGEKINPKPFIYDYNVKNQFSKHEEQVIVTFKMFF